MSTDTSRRTHSNGVTVTVFREGDAGPFACIFSSQTEAGFQPTQQTEIGAQAYADQRIAATGHVCNGNCSEWRAIDG